MKNNTEHKKGGPGLSREQIDGCASDLIEAIQNGATLKDLHGMKNETLDDVYSLAYEFYQHGKLDEAESLFRFLCIYDFYNPDYALGLAAVHQLKKNYTKTIDIYALAYALSENDYRPMFYAGQCNLMLKRTIQARHCFSLVEQRCSDQPLVIKAAAYLKAINDVAESSTEDMSDPFSGDK